MKIKEIFDEIANESSTNEKMNILSKYKDNSLLKKVLYLANSGRIKFYIRQIPEYNPDSEPDKTLEWALNGLEKITSREYTGNQAILWLQTLLTCLSKDDAYILERIIEKDCKIGMGTSNINKVFPKLIEKTSYMGCLPFDPKRVHKIFDESKGKGAICEIKADGRYCNIIIENNGVSLTSRQGEETLLDGSLLVHELSKFDNCVLNGELVISPKKTLKFGKNDLINLDGKLLSVDEFLKIYNETIK